MNEQTYEIMRRITVVNNPQFATEIKVMTFDDLRDLLNVTTQRSTMLKGLEPGVDYITVDDTILIPLSTVIAMVHSSRMPNKANVKFALMQELYSNTIVQTGITVNAIEDQLAKVFEAYVNNSAKTEELLAKSFQSTFQAVYAALNYATIDSVSEELNEEEFAEPVVITEPDFTNNPQHTEGE